MAIVINISDKPLKNPLREKLEMMDRKRWERVKAAYLKKNKDGKRRRIELPERNLL